MSASIVTAALLVLFLPGDSLGCCMKVNVSSKQFCDEQGRSRLFQGLNVVRAFVERLGRCMKRVNYGVLCYHSVLYYCIQVSLQIFFHVNCILNMSLGTDI